MLKISPKLRFWFCRVCCGEMTCKAEGVNKFLDKDVLEVSELWIFSGFVFIWKNYLYPINRNINFNWRHNLKGLSVYRVAFPIQHKLLIHPRTAALDPPTVKVSPNLMIRINCWDEKQFYNFDIWNKLRRTKILIDLNRFGIKGLQSKVHLASACLKANMIQRLH